MKPFIFALAIVSTTTFLPVQAQIYQWKDANGRTVISDTPPAGAARQARITTTITPSENTKPPEASKSLAERDLDLKKRQKETKEKTDKENQETSAKADLQEACLRARQQLISFESGQRISSMDINGERRYMEDAERQRESERTRKYLAENCK